MNFLAQKLIVTGTFHTWIFRHGDLSAEGHFGSGTFRLMDILAKWTFQHSNTFQHCAKMSVPKHLYCFAWCQNFPVLKRPCAETSMETEFPCAGTSTEPKSSHAEMFLWLNFRAEMSLAEMSGAKISPSLMNGQYSRAVYNQVYIVCIFIYSIVFTVLAPP